MTPTSLRLMGQVVAVADLDAAARDFERCSLCVGPEYSRAGLNARKIQLRDSFLLLVAPPERAASPLADAVRRHLDQHGEGVLAAVISTPEAPPALTDRAWADFLEVSWAAGRGITASGACLTLFVPQEETLISGSQPDAPRLYTHIYALHDITDAQQFTMSLGLEPWAMYRTDLWHLDTIVTKLAGDTHLEFCQPVGRDRPASDTISRRLERTGDCHYMTVLWVEDTDRWFDEFTRRGVPTLGQPVPGPPESPWGAAPELWIHPSQTHGMFIELLADPA